MRFDVINVGDGACTVLRPEWDERGLTIIDCGTHNHSRVAVKPAELVAAHLGGQLADLDTLVVTHFDIDHWHGLLDLADFYAQRAHTGRRIRLRYPGMAEVGHGVTAAQVRAGIMALVSTRDESPLNVLRLKERWGHVSHVSAEPLFRGDPPVEIGGRDWTVHWPPRQVSTGRGRRYAEVVEAIWELGREMASDGFPDLYDRLEEAYGQVDRLHDHSEEQRTTDHPEPPDVALEDFANDVTEEGERRVSIPERIPERYRDKFRDLAKATVGIDNYFSLVLSCDDEIIVFGDIEGTALRAVLEETDPRFALNDHYDVVLAPHHGSHHTHGRSLPSAHVCIAQNGSKHHSKNSVHRRLHGLACHHLSTWEHGTLSFYGTPVCW